MPDEASLAADPHGLIRSVFLELVKLYKKKIDTLREKKINVFALLHGQMSEESKCEVGSMLYKQSRRTTQPAGFVESYNGNSFVFSDWNWSLGQKIS